MAGLTTSKPETTSQEMFNAIGDSLSNLASSDEEEDGVAEDDDEEDPVGGKFSQRDEPGLVMGTIPKPGHYPMGHFPQMQMKLDESTQPGQGDAANYFSERDEKYGTTELKAPGVV